jgi:CBS domain-containing protein
MRISDLMTRGVWSCSVHDSLREAAKIMWDHDCGCVPVIDDSGRVVGMLTDRDVCIAGYTQGKPYEHIPVAVAMSKKVFGVAAHEDVERAERLMRDKQLRRLPVVDHDGMLEGIVALSDIARRVEPGHATDGLTGDGVATTLAAIGKPHHRRHVPAKIFT